MKFYASTSSNTVLWTGTKEQVIGLLQSCYCSHVSNGSLPSEPSESRPLKKTAHVCLLNTPEIHFLWWWMRTYRELLKGLSSVTAKMLPVPLKLSEALRLFEFVHSVTVLICPLFLSLFCLKYWIKWAGAF